MVYKLILHDVGSYIYGSYINYSFINLHLVGDALSCNVKLKASLYRYIPIKYFLK